MPLEQGRQAGLAPKTGLLQGQCTLAAPSPSDTQEPWGASPGTSPGGSRCCSGVLGIESGHMRPNEDPESHLAFIPPVSFSNYSLISISFSNF